MIGKGQPWERPASAPPDWEVRGGDSALAASVRDHPGARIRFDPSPECDLARAVGLEQGPARGPARHELLMDALRVHADGREHFVVNMVVVGTPPDRLRRHSRARHVTVRADEREVFTGSATTIVVATGQYLRGHDVVPRGHPGDGRAEVQVFWPTRRGSERQAMRTRLATGTHVPHPHIAQASGRRITLTVAGRPAALELDGVEAPPATAVVVEVLAGAYSLLV